MQEFVWNGLSQCLFRAWPLLEGGGAQGHPSQREAAAALKSLIHGDNFSSTEMILLLLRGSNSTPVCAWWLSDARVYLYVYKCACALLDTQEWGSLNPADHSVDTVLGSKPFIKMCLVNSKSQSSQTLQQVFGYKQRNTHKLRDETTMNYLDGQPKEGQQLASCALQE